MWEEQHQHKIQNMIVPCYCLLILYLLLYHTICMEKNNCTGMSVFLVRPRQFITQTIIMRYFIYLCPAANCRCIWHICIIYIFKALLPSETAEVFASHGMNNAPLNFSQTEAHKMHDEPPKLSLYSTNAPEGAAPLYLATFSKPLVEIQCYSPLENLRMCADS